MLILIMKVICFFIAIAMFLDVIESYQYRKEKDPHTKFSEVLRDRSGSIVIGAISVVALFT